VLAGPANGDLARVAGPFADIIGHETYDFGTTSALSARKNAPVQILTGSSLSVFSFGNVGRTNWFR
jgi:hypothetical protein